MAVYSYKNKEMGHLIDGDFFGELSLVTNKEIRNSYVVAVTSCKVSKPLMDFNYNYGDFISTKQILSMFILINSYRNRCEDPRSARKAQTRQRIV